MDIGVVVLVRWWGLHFCHDPFWRQFRNVRMSKQAYRALGHGDDKNRHQEREVEYMSLPRMLSSWGTSYVHMMTMLFSVGIYERFA
jgi:hypothetical protein